MITTLEEYAKDIIAKLEESLGNGYWCKTQYIIKNNDIQHFGIIVRNEDEMISPVIYIDNYYQNHMDIDYVVGDILNTLNKECDEPKFDLDNFSNFESVKGQVQMRLINYESNRAYLENLVYIKFLDLAIVFHVGCLSNFKSGMCTITVTKDILQLWNIDESHLLEVAQSNMQKYTDYVLKDLISALSDLGDYSQPEGCEVGMYVLTNSEGIFGAAQVVNQGVLSEVSKKLNSDLILLPSSVHEWIILPDNLNTLSVDDLKSIVKEINTTQVAACDVLSNNVYYYNRLLNKLMIAE